jgi:hypothetical protein
MRAAIALGTRPDRIRLLLQLQNGRRNQIAYEGDRDSAALDFRVLEDMHVRDFMVHMKSLIDQFELLLK